MFLIILFFVSKTKYQYRRMIMIHLSYFMSGKYHSLIRAHYPQVKCVIPASKRPRGKEKSKINLVTHGTIGAFLVSTKLPSETADYGADVHLRLHMPEYCCFREGSPLFVSPLVPSETSNRQK